jgi:hypothetical protein
VAVSGDATFNADGTVVWVIARVDMRANDPDGLCLVKSGVTRSRSKDEEAPAGRARTPDAA